MSNSFAIALQPVIIASQDVLNGQFPSKPGGHWLQWWSGGNYGWSRWWHWTPQWTWAAGDQTGSV